MTTTQGLIAHARRQVAPSISARLLLMLAVSLTGAVLLASDSARSTASQPRPAASDSLPSEIGLINQQIQRQWSALGLAPSPPASDGEWCRRVFLDLLGRIPTIEELEQFQSEPGAQRKARLVERLLGQPYLDEYARNWTTLWTNILIGRSGGTERRTLVNREGLQQSLRDALARNLSYDRLVYELVAAKGASKPGESGFNGFVNFLAGSLEENAVQATAKTSQVFLGVQVQCTQCHNHPFNDWKQNQFWELNAFFRQTRALRRFASGREVEFVELVNEDFAGEDGRPEEAVVFYELRNGLSKPAYPVFIDGTALKSNSGFVADVDRRTELAKLITAHHNLPKALVNRMWSHFLGYGFTRPIDDIGPHVAPSHPELLAELAGQFRAQQFDLKELMRWIVLSQPYALSSKTTQRNQKDDPALGVKPAFSHFYLRQMRAEELYESLLVATEAHQAQSNSQSRERTKREWLAQFTVAFGTDDNEETTTFNGTIPQTLMMMNGDLIQQATSVAKGGFLHRVASDGKLSNAAKIQRLYLAALARRPTAQEIALANQLLVARNGDATAALQDVWWAVLNSNEFILNH